MQNAITLAFSQAGRVTIRQPDLGASQPVSPVQYSLDEGCGRGLFAVGEVGDGIGVSEEPTAGQHEELIESHEEEVQPARSIPTPYIPTQAEIDEHVIDHMPYRCWCRHCLNGFGREDAHRTQGHPHRVPTVSFDYMFVTKDDAYERSEWEALGERDQDYMKVVVIRDSKSKSLFAHAVPRKGVDEQRYVVNCVVDECAWPGYSRITIKSDNEKAIGKLVQESLKGLRITGQFEQVCEERSVPNDPATNGNAEAGVKLVKCAFKTLRSCLEQSLGHKIPIAHPILAWLVCHAADTRTFRIRSDDGTTAYQKVRGKQFTSRMLRFAESCHFKTRSNETLKDGERAYRWKQGLFLGIDNITGQYKLFPDGQIKFSRTIRRMPDPEKFQLDRVKDVMLTPWEARVSKSEDVIFRERIDAEQKLIAAREQAIRQIKRAPLKRSDIDDFGHTPGCPKCEHSLRYGCGRTSQPHSEACRTRMYDKFLTTEKGQQRIARMGQRRLEVMTEYLEQSETLKALQEDARSKGEEPDVVVPRHPPPKLPASDAERPEPRGDPTVFQPVVPDVTPPTSLRERLLSTII